jgi:hypothetical protein
MEDTLPPKCRGTRGCRDWNHAPPLHATPANTHMPPNVGSFYEFSNTVQLQRRLLLAAANERQRACWRRCSQIRIYPCAHTTNTWSKGFMTVCVNRHESSSASAVQATTHALARIEVCFGVAGSFG